MKSSLRIEDPSRILLMNRELGLRRPLRIPSKLLSVCPFTIPKPNLCVCVCVYHPKPNTVINRWQLRKSESARFWHQSCRQYRSRCLVQMACSSQYTLGWILHYQLYWVTLRACPAIRGGRSALFWFRKTHCLWNSLFIFDPKTLCCHFRILIDLIWDKGIQRMSFSVVILWFNMRQECSKNVFSLHEWGEYSLFCWQPLSLILEEAFH